MKKSHIAEYLYIREVFEILTFSVIKIQIYLKFSCLKWTYQIQIYLCIYSTSDGKIWTYIDIQEKLIKYWKYTIAGATHNANVRSIFLWFIYLHDITLLYYVSKSRWSFFFVISRVWGADWLCIYKKSYQYTCYV